MSKRVIACIVTLLLAAFPAAAAAKDVVTVKDMTGRNVSLPQHPDRIACLSPGTLRLIVYLQAQDRLVGIEDLEKKFPTTRPYYLAHPDLGQLSSIGPGGPNSINKEPDYEKILSAKPDVIFITYMEADLADQVQKKIGIPVFVLTYGPFGTFTDQVFDSIMAAGRVLGRENRARAVVDYIQGSRQNLRDRVQNVPADQNPWAYIGGIGFKGTHGIESTETNYAPFEWVTARNAAQKEGQTGHLFIDKERLLEIDPDVIFIDGGGKDLVRQDYEKKSAFYQGLKAFQNKKVYTLHSFNWYMTNLGTVITDAFTVGKILYPARFKDVDLAERADAVYDFLVGRPLYAEMKKIHGPLGQTAPFLK